MKKKKKNHNQNMNRQITINKLSVAAALLITDKQGKLPNIN